MDPESGLLIEQGNKPARKMRLNPGLFTSVGPVSLLRHIRTMKLLTNVPL